jgi:hypothetical protein
MDTARQFLRWGLPGSVAAFAIFGLQVSLDLVFGTSLSSIGVGIGRWLGGAGAVFILSAIVPLGFLIYQCYYYFPNWVLRFGGFTSRDTFGNVLDALPDHARTELIARGHKCGIDAFHLNHTPRQQETTIGWWFLKKHLWRMTADHRIGSNRRSYSLSCETNRELVHHLIAATPSGLRERLVTEYTSLSDLYHSASATRIALHLAFTTWITYNAVSHLARFSNLRALLAAPVGMAAWFLGTKMLRAASNRILISREAMLRLALIA